MNSPLTGLGKLVRRSIACVVWILSAGLLLAMFGAVALRAVSADTLGKFSLAAQSRAGRLIKKIAPIAFVPALAAPSAKLAAPFACNNLTVNNLGDGTDATPGNGVCETAAGNGICTLRAAIQESNASTSCSPLTISFSVNGTITLGSNLPNITRSVTITGNGTANTIISGNNLYRSLNSISTDGLTVTIQNLKATNGFVAGSGFGGAIDLDSLGGTLTVNNVIFTNGMAGYGGGINADDGTLNINNCIFSNNTGNTVSAGIWVGSTVTTTLVNCLFTGNSGPAGAVFSNGGTLKIYNSTVADNSASNAAYAAGVRNNGGTMTIYNSILANNSGGSGDCVSVIGPLDVQRTLIKNVGCGITNGVNGNLTGDPALNPDYTLTSASNAVGTGNNSLIPSGVTTDLAGNARIQQSVVDLGAYESPFVGIVPTLGNYSATTVNLGAQTTVMPSAAPTDATNLVATASSGFNGTFYANPATGVVKVINANPAGVYTVRVTSFRPAGSASKSFTLTVQSGTACATAPILSSAPDLTVASSNALAVGDFNNDGKQDVAISNYLSTTVSILLGNGAGGFTSAGTVTAGSNPYDLAIGDFNGDGNLDLAAICNSGVIFIRLGDGAGNFSGATSLNSGLGGVSIAVGDFNNDGKLDLVTANLAANTSSVRLGDGAGGFGGSTNVSVGTGPRRVVVGDFNNDGKLDFATVNQTANTVSIRLGDGAGNFSGTTEITVGTSPQYLALGDFNKDGKLDFAASNGNSNTLSVRLGDGLGGFTGTTEVSFSNGVSPVVVGDFNNDGNPDIAAQTPFTIAYLLGDGLGGFSAPATILSSSNSGEMRVGDFNQDGRQDLITSNLNSGIVHVLLGGCNAPPSITAGAALTRQQGSAGASGTIATVSDTETAAGSLTVTATTVPTGISVTGITNTSGTITATVAASCTATVGANTVVLTVTDGNGATNTANLTVNVTAAPAPTISTQPAAQTVCVGSTATFAVTTANAVSYQWRKNGTNISGATSSSYMTPATVAGDNGALYSVVITGACGTVASNNAALTVNTTTAITSQPTNQTVCAGSSATFSVTASGTGLTYQWRKGGANIAGATASSYTIASTTAADAASYDVAVTGSCGNLTSSAATLTVNAAPAITTQPTNQTVCAGSSASFSVAASGAGLTYQWKKNGTNISGATASTYSLPSAAAADAATYTVVVSGTCGTPVTSAGAILTVNPTTAITTQPQAQTVCAGSSATLSVAAAGSGLSYQWRKGGVNIAGATASSYTIASTAASDAANYDVVVTGACGTATSSAAALTVNPATTITTQPASLSRITGQSATFSVMASGTGTLTYQWRKNGNPISGATASSYTIASVTPADAGNYSIVVTGGCGAVTSNVAVLNVDCVVVTVGPPSLPGGTVGVTYNQQLTVTPTGSYNFTVSSGAMPTGLSLNSSTGAITGMPTAAGAFSFSISATDANSCSGAQSYTVTICAPPAFTTQPLAQTVCAGASATFSVVATGSGLSYQWRKGGAAISGATSASFTIASPGAVDAAQYDVVVTGTCGTATSTAAALTVNPVTAITTPPANQTTCEGSAASFSVVATGTGLGYRWRKNGVNIAGATSGTYSIPSVTTADAASYDVVVTGSCGSNQTSAAAALTVNTAPAITTPPTDQTVCAGAAANFSVAATGTGLSYQWKKNGVNISGATAGTYNIAAATAADAATYAVVVSGACGTPVTSAGAVLTVNAATSVTTQPANQATCLGGSVTFTVTAAGANLTYQWRKGGVNLAGATASSYTVASATAADAASYDVVVTGACGTVTSNAATLTINSGTNINTQPQNQTVCAGGAATFSVVASGSGTVTYQWRKNGTNIGGATASSLTLNPVAAADAASYDAVVTSGCGTATSNAATLTVNAVTAISAQPQAATVCMGASASFSVTASGAGLSYQWRKNGANISGATASSYTIAAANAADAASYGVVVTGACGSVTSNAAGLTVNATTAINTQPAAQTKLVGESVSFGVTAAGVNLTYQWRKSGVNIPGATSSGYSIAALAQSDAGNYDVVVTGTCGAATSNVATLTVNCPALTLTPPTLPSAATGAAYSQTLTATGGASPYNFTLAGGTLPTGLTLTPAGSLSGTPTASGSFTFTVRATDANNCFGERQYTIGTDCATVTVTPADPALPGGTAGTPYSQSFVASGGATPYGFTSTGALPNGLTLSGNGALAGTPVGFGVFNFTVKATDANGCFGERAYTLRICAIISLAPTTLPAATTGAAYDQTLTASGGASPYSLAVTGGNLPPGLSLSSAGALAGTLTQSGSFSFTVTATDANGCTGAQSYTLGVGCQTITVAPASLPNGFVGAAYGQSLTASGGTAPYAFTVSTGKLPGGLTLNANGALTGTPTAQATFSFTVRATDANGCFGERSYTVLVSGGGLQFYPLPAPVRLLDTRAGASPNACSQPNAAIAGGTSRMQAARSFCGLPAGAQAITGNITTVQSGGGYLTLYPSDAAQPLVANSNYDPNQILNNVFTVGLGAGDGAFKIFVTSNTDVVVDVTGFYAPPGAGGLFFHPLPKPIRLLETRAGFGGCNAPGAPLPGGVETTQGARLTCDGVTIPATALAITGNATTVNPAGPGFPYLTLFPADAARPLVASSNYLPGQIMNAPFTVGLSAAGEFKIYPTTQTDLVIDVLGYYSAEATDGNGTGLLFNPLPTPVRLLETRAGFTGCYTPNAPLLAGSTHNQQARGVCGAATIAATALAIVGNATVVNDQAGYLTFWPNGAAQPLVATSNFTTGQVFNRHFTVGLSAAGVFNIFTSVQTDLVIDVSGFFAP